MSLPAVAASVLGGLRDVWLRRQSLSVTGALRLFIIGVFLSLTASSALQFVGGFKEQYDYELHIMPEALKLNQTCTMIEASRLFMDGNMTDSCARARYRLTVSPLWRAFYQQLPTLTTFTSTSDLIKTAVSVLWHGLVSLFENNKLFFFFLMLGAWGFGEPLWRLLRNALRDRFNRRRERELERLRLLQQQQHHRRQQAPPNVVYLSGSSSSTAGATPFLHGTVAPAPPRKQLEDGNNSSEEDTMNRVDKE